MWIPSSSSCLQNTRSISPDNTQTLLFGLIGYPLGHSWSETWFNRRFREEGIENAKYSLFPIEDIRSLPGLLEREKDLCGFNVTIPHKSGIIRYLDRIDPAAGKIGAVNLVLVHRDNTGIRLAGFNTDAPAFRATLPEPFPYRHALVLGTGGAAKATGYVLESLGTEVLFVTRNAVQANSISYEDLNRQPGLLDRFTFIVNATPVGMSPQTKYCPGIPWDSIGPAHYLYDLIYNPERTLFLEKGSERGARIQNGTEMFYSQAEAGFRLFKENYF